MQAIQWSNIKYGQASTPLTYYKENPKPPSRKLWKKENVCPNYYSEESFEYVPTPTENWDKIQSPQYVNFLNAIGESKSSDTFFDKDRNENVFKPQNPRVQKLPGTDGDDPLLSALFQCSLSKVKMEEGNQVPLNNVIINKETKASTLAKHAKIKDERKNDGGKSQRPTVTPFSFEWRDKCKQERKQDRVNKVLQEEKKQVIFRANPVPKFVKSNPPTTLKSSTIVKTEDMKPHEKPIKKIEIWKKEPFRPCPSTKILAKARTPKLSTALRAQQRKRFDDRMKEREKQLELSKQLEEIAKKKHEEEEIARLRKQTVHKAQPIRRYKAGLPEVQKRPLTDPTSPLLSFKRRRRV